MCFRVPLERWRTFAVRRAAAVAAAFNANLVELARAARLCADFATAIGAARHRKRGDRCTAAAWTRDFLYECAQSCVEIYETIDDKPAEKFKRQKIGLFVCMQIKVFTYWLGTPAIVSSSAGST